MISHIGCLTTPRRIAIVAQAFITDLRIQAHLLGADLLRQAKLSSSDAPLRTWQAARDSQITSAPYEIWLGDRAGEAASAWLVATALVRFCEDNRLIEAPFVAAPDTERQAFAMDRQQAYFVHRPDRHDGDWIGDACNALTASPSSLHLLDPLRPLMAEFPLPHKTAKSLLSFWRRRDESGQLVHDLTDPGFDTSFLGDLYQDLSEHARMTYALLQTPEFVVDFMLKYTIDRLLDTRGRDVQGLRVIDPVCGSGTFLLGVFHRLLGAWKKADAGRSTWERIRLALTSIHGTDKYPVAVTISRFRLLIAAMKADGARRLSDVPGLPFCVEVCDSLVSTERIVSEDNLLSAGSYDVVVGNPPYTMVKDPAESATYRSLYPVCRGRYALTVPFISRFFQLARRRPTSAGYVAILTANSFMKREFGSGLIEDFLPTIELTHIIDTSGAYIPGHGTPTAILIGRNRPPTAPTIRTALALRGEPAQPSEPANGLVWNALRRQLDESGSVSGWIQVEDLDRALFAHHPWSLSSSRDRDVLRVMETGAQQLKSRVARIGYFAATGADDAFTAPSRVFQRIGTEPEPTIQVLRGEEVRDWNAAPEDIAFSPGNIGQELDITNFPGHLRRLWPYRTVLRNRNRQSFSRLAGKVDPWYGWHQVAKTTDAHPWSITFSWVATHQHFALVRGRVAQLQSAPVVNLGRDASNEDFFELLTVLNSSAACFWLKQYSNSKGAPKLDQLRADEAWMQFYEFTSTRLAQLPLPRSVSAQRGRLLDQDASELSALQPTEFFATEVPFPELLEVARKKAETIRSRMIASQEELDWDIYHRYGLLSDAEITQLIAEPDDLPELKLGERAFEIVMARKMRRGELETQWFARHGSTPITKIPKRWPQPYRDVVAKRIEVIETRRVIGLIERPEYKRRWNSESWENAERHMLMDWLLNRCEDRSLWYGPDGQPRPMTVQQLADLLCADGNFVRVARLLAGSNAELADMIRNITADEHVPYLAKLRYKPDAWLKRSQWEQAWELQRDEDRTRKRLDIPVPPSYKSSDFVAYSYWRNRGKLDVPKERFISYPNANSDSDDSPLLGWAGWNHREQAQALVTLIEERSATGGWSATRITPLLVGLAEVMPWVRQWHHEIDERFGVSLAETYDTYLASQREKYGLSEENLQAWTPPPVRRGRPPKKPQASTGGDHTTG